MNYEDVDVNVNSTLLFGALFMAVEKGWITRFEMDLGKYNIGAPPFKVIKSWKEYIVEPNLKTYGIYSYNDYYGGLGLPLFESDSVFEIIDYFVKEL